jgi:hypothetical protein
MPQLGRLIPKYQYAPGPGYRILNAAMLTSAAAKELHMYAIFRHPQSCQSLPAAFATCAGHPSSVIGCYPWQSARIGCCKFGPGLRLREHSARMILAG